MELYRCDDCKGYCGTGTCKRDCECHAGDTLSCLEIARCAKEADPTFDLSRVAGVHRNALFGHMWSMLSEKKLDTCIDNMYTATSLAQRTQMSDDQWVPQNVAHLLKHITVASTTKRVPLWQIDGESPALVITTQSPTMSYSDPTITARKLIQKAASKTKRKGMGKAPAKKAPAKKAPAKKAPAKKAPAKKGAGEEGAGEEAQLQPMLAMINRNIRFLEWRKCVSNDVTVRISTQRSRLVIEAEML